MKIKNIELTYFRNYQQGFFSFDPDLTVIVGENGQGKTNLLESIAYFSELRSFRNTKDKDLIFHDESYAFLKCETDHSKLAITIGYEGRSLSINRQKIKKSSDFYHCLHTVIFSPNDVYFFDQSPKYRRRFLDLELSKLSLKYLSHSIQYQSLLKQRNKLLKEKRIDPILIESIDDQILTHFSILRRQRYKFIEKLSKKTSEFFNLFSSSQHKLSLNYIHDGYHENDQELKNILKSNMKQSFEKDCFYRLTHIGVHRDDLTCLFDGFSIIDNASQGLKRLVVLSFKLALIQIIYEEKKYTPILLLDDVLSELDIVHQKKLINKLPVGIQTIITTTHIDFIEYLKRKPKIIQIKQGKQEEETQWKKKTY